VAYTKKNPKKGLSLPGLSEILEREGRNGKRLDLLNLKAFLRKARGSCPFLSLRGIEEWRGTWDKKERDSRNKRTLLKKTTSGIKEVGRQKGVGVIRSRKKSASKERKK